MPVLQPPALMVCVVYEHTWYCTFHCPEEAIPLGKKGAESGLKEQFWVGFAVLVLKHASRFAAEEEEMGKKGEQ